MTRVTMTRVMFWREKNSRVSLDISTDIIFLLWQASLIKQWVEAQKLPTKNHILENKATTLVTKSFDGRNFYVFVELWLQNQKQSSWNKPAIWTVSLKRKRQHHVWYFQEWLYIQLSSFSYLRHEWRKK